MEYPIPKHLKEVFRVSNFDGHDLDGKIVCTCGCNAFGIKYFGWIWDDGGLAVVNEGEGYALVVKAVCRDCKKEWLIFDLSKHGFEGLVNEGGVPVPEKMLKCYSCCDNSSYEFDIGIETEDPEQFIEEVVNEEFSDGKFTPEDYVDAFDWLVIHLKCTHCGRKFRDWINLELS